MAQEEDLLDAEYDQMPMMAQVGAVTHAMMVDGITSMPGSIDNGDEYGDEMVNDGAPEFSKYKRDKVFLPVESTRRKSKITCTIGPSTSEVEDIV